MRQQCGRIGRGSEVRMAFRLPVNLAIRQRYVVVVPEDVTALEQSLPANSRVLVGLVFSERYDGFNEDCLRANEALLAEAGLLMWPELNQFITPDEDGEPIAWISYLSSPAWWTFLLIILGGIFLLPIITVLPIWITGTMFPGITDLITLGIMMFLMFAVMRPMTKGLAPTKEKK